MSSTAEQQWVNNLIRDNDDLKRENADLRRQLALPALRLDTGPYSIGWNDCIRWINQSRAEK